MREREREKECRVVVMVAEAIEEGERECCMG